MSVGRSVRPHRRNRARAHRTSGLAANACLIDLRFHPPAPVPAAASPYLHDFAHLPKNRTTETFASVIARQTAPDGCHAAGHSGKFFLNQSGGLAPAGLAAP